MEINNWKTVTLSQLAQLFDTDLKTGLSLHAAQIRLQKLGPNKITRQSTRWYHVLIHQFTSQFIMLLLVAAGLSFIIDNLVQGLVIIAMLGINAFAEFYQEYQSSQVLKLLQNLLVSSVVVIRDGKKNIISEEAIVPGDLIVLAAGDKIPADVRITFAEGLLVDESLLTGESDPVSKSAENYSHEREAYKKSCCFAGSTVIAGQGIGVVTVTANATELGKITGLTTEISVAGVFAKDLNTFTWLMIALILRAFFMVLGIKWYFQHDAYNIFDVLMFALVVAVSITPESLPVIITFSLSQAAHALAKKNVVVKRLSALNDLGAIQILCVDKTATLTENRLRVVDVWNNISETTLWGFLGSGHLDAQALQDPLDKALWDALIARNTTSVLTDYSIIRGIPFNPVHRRSGSIVKKDTNYWLLYRGAFESLIDQCEQPIASKLLEWFIAQKK
jgi:magnesium-transporting ATPase (P-type)